MKTPQAIQDIHAFPDGAREAIYQAIFFAPQLRGQLIRQLIGDQAAAQAAANATVHQPGSGRRAA